MAWRTPDQVNRIAVIGCGLIGAGWVSAYLASGRSVAVYDPAPDAAERVRAHVSRCRDQMAALGLGQANLDALSFHDALENALAGADFVQENGPERLADKAALFAKLDMMLPPDVIVASSTSSLPISDLSAGCSHAERFVLGHPFNPVHLMPLVEVGGGRRTDPCAIAAAEALYTAMGKRTVRLQREIFGHIANRLTSAMFREAVSLVAEGVATVADVDAAIRYGPALKWAIQGQFTTFHTSGGEAGLEGFLRHFADGIIRRWETMSEPDLADPELQAELVRQIREAHPDETVEQIAARQDRLLVELLRMIESLG